jgi:hypothetical protein
VRVELNSEHVLHVYRELVAQMLAPLDRRMTPPLSHQVHSKFKLASLLASSLSARINHCCA